MVPGSRVGGSAASCVLLVAPRGALGEPPAGPPPPGLGAAVPLHVLAGQPGATVASLLTGVAARVHGVDREAPALGYPGPTLAELLRAAGRRTVAFSDHPAVAWELGFGRGFEDFLQTAEPVSGFRRWLEERGGDEGAFFALVCDAGAWQSAPDAAGGGARRRDLLAELIVALERRGALPTTVVIAVGEAAGDSRAAAAWPALAPATMLVRHPGPSPVLSTGGAPVGPADVLPTLLAMVAAELPPDLPLQGRCLLATGERDVGGAPAVLIDAVPDRALALEWTLAVDPAWTCTRLEARPGRRRRLLRHVTWRRLAALRRPALRQPLLAVMRHGRFESWRRRQDPAAGGGSGGGAPALAFARDLDRWRAQCDTVQRAAAKWQAGPDQAALRQRLRGLGYLA